jgi:cob(I)alamin adenosyltransferase
MSKLERGLIHVYTGDGKGKTTAALGLALRAAGCGFCTYVCQFLKGQEYGELEAARWLEEGALHAAALQRRMQRPPITIERFGQPTFVHISADGARTTATEEDVRLAREGLAAARRAMEGGLYELVVLDEINVALYFQLLTVQEVLEVIDHKPEGVELVLTGRRVPDEILARADYVTEMHEVRHPYQQGIRARRGIEF